MKPHWHHPGEPADHEHPVFQGGDGVNQILPTRDARGVLHTHRISQGGLDFDTIEILLVAEIVIPA